MPFIGKGYIETLYAASVIIQTPAGADINGYATPNLRSLKLTHSATVDRIPGPDGLIRGIIGNNEFVECAWDYIPEGGSHTAAKISAQLPTVPSAIVVSGLPVIIIGPFADVFNGVWIYEGGGSLSADSESKWMASFTLRRYPLITTKAQIANA
jgi:hypothetical protein